MLQYRAAIDQITSSLTCDRRETGDAGVPRLPLKTETRHCSTSEERSDLASPTFSLTFLPSLNLTGPSITGVRSHIFRPAADSAQSRGLIITPLQWRMVSFIHLNTTIYIFFLLQGLSSTVKQQQRRLLLSLSNPEAFLHPQSHNTPTGGPGV